MKTDVPSLKRMLRERGLRATLQRMAVLKELAAAGGPVSHGQVADRLAASGFDRATIYRNLISLTDCGLVSRSDLGDHTWRFELVGDKGHDASAHPHFVCDSCGSIKCMPEGSVQVRAPRRAPEAVRRRRFTVRLSGLCDSCA